MASLRKHDVWTLLPCTSVPAGRKIVGSRPYFLRQRNEKGEVIRNKVRVVTKGYSQVEGIDYTDTYTPITRMESMRTLLHVSASLDWEIHQLDVKTAFLHGDLEEEI